MLIAGVDEVGRGPLAGAVVAAAVILDPDKPISGLNDSKKLSHKKRERLNEIILNNCLCYGIGRAEVDEIDQINILQATFLAMQRAVSQLSITPQKVVVDGNRSPEFGLPTECIIGGDGLVAEVSAASIIAKVYRDREMCQLAIKYPHYGFEKHKGYGTKIHLNAINEYGICNIHRKSFAPIKNLI